MMSAASQLLFHRARALAAVKLALVIAPPPLWVLANQASMIVLSSLVVPVPSKAWFRGATAAPPMAVYHNPHLPTKPEIPA